MTQSGHWNMARFQLLFWLTFVISNASGQPVTDAADQVEACRSELAKRQSSNVVDGQLTAQWSVAWTISYSESRLTFVSIRHSIPEQSPDYSQLTHDWAILCTVDESGRVVSLVSPEKSDLVQFVENGESVEDREYELIAEKLNAGTSVYRYDTYYRIDGDGVAQLGEARQSAVDPSDFGVE